MWIKIIFKISFVSSSLLKSLFSALTMNCWPIVKIIWYFVVCRWFWHFYCSGLLIHSALLTVMVYSVFVADKFPEEVSLFLGYIRIPASESGILRKMFLNTWVRVIVLDDCIYILRNNVLKCKCLQFPLTSWKHDHSAWILLKVAQQRHAKQSWCWQVLTKIFCTCNTKFQECARTKTLYSRASDRKCCQNLCFRYREW